MILEEIKMVEDTPDDLVHEIFTEHYWAGHPLGRPILGTPRTVESFTREALTAYFHDTYIAPNLIVSAAGNLRHDALRGLIEQAFAGVGTRGSAVNGSGPSHAGSIIIRGKDLEQSHICLGTEAFHQSHADRYTAYILNTVLGGSMSSRLFQNIREKRGLAYAVFSGLSAYRDAGMLTVYAGCAAESVGQVVDLIVEELRGMKQASMLEAELRRSKDHLKGSLMLSLESTSSRMSHLARQDIYFDRHETLDETLAGIEAVTAAEVQRVAGQLFSNGSIGVTVLGPDTPGLAITPARLELA